MSVQLSMFSPPTLPDTDKCIASPDSAAGPTRSGSPDGLMIDPSGPEAAPASRSARPGKAAAPMIRATFGLRGSGSSASASLQSSLVSKLQQQLPTDGSILWRMTWKVKATPSGRCVSRLQASARGISESGYGSWPSPSAQEPGGTPERHLERKREWVKKGAKMGTTSVSHLSLSVQLASWRSPTAGLKGGGGSDGLRRLAQGHMLNLQDQVTPAGWATASARDWKDTPGMAETATNPDGSVRIRLDQLPRQAALIGPLSPGSTAATTSAGRFRLNPLFSLWLMGYPPHAWASCAVRAMPSSRTSLRK